MKTVLCIGGSDPSGGAGIQIDIPTVYAHGLVPLTAITALTSQNSEGVYDFLIPEPQNVRFQLEVLDKDYNIDAVKIGMLGNADNVKLVTTFIRDSGIKHVIIDPVFKSTTGFNLLDDEGILLLKEELLQSATVVTPNLNEAQYLTQTEIKNVEDMKNASKLIIDFKIDSVVIKGGHLPGDKSTDVVYDGIDFSLIEGKRINSDLRGTGCMYASSLACNLANGINLYESAKNAKGFVEKMIKNGHQVGNGSRQVTSFKE